MANDNNNKTKSASPTDEDPTAEFEIPSSLQGQPLTSSPEIEVDEDTYDIEDTDAGYQQLSKGALKQELEVRQQRVEELEFDLEQLRAKYRGAVEELQAHQDIANSLGSTAESARLRQSEAESRLRETREELDALRIALDNSSERSTKLNEENRTLKTAASESEQQIESLKAQLDEQDLKICGLQSDLREARLRPASLSDSEDQRKKELEDLNSALQQARQEATELRAYIDARHAEWQEREDEVSRLTENLASADSARGETDDRVALLAAELESLRQRFASTSEQLKDAKTRSKELRAENRKLARELNDGAGRELEQNREVLATRAGEIIALRREIDGLRRDNSRLEEYADSLRIQLQDQIAIAKISMAMRRKLEIGLDLADGRIAELASSLEESRLAEGKLQERLVEQDKLRENEIRQIRFELGAAQETISDQETINQQLASDLVNQQEFKQALEAQLEKAERKNHRSIRTLTEDLAQKRKEVEELERSILAKDRAIADLMHELTEHSAKIEVKADTSSTLQGIDGFGSRQTRAARGEKTTRQLIGNADGRELRFPLFKDRLTIGRTSHNDIQLNMQFVSRRHAVIATDHGTTRVIDWGSKNGVFVNRERVTERILNSGDVVTIGTTEFRYEEHNKK